MHRNRQSGQNFVEYALILVVVLVMIIVIVGLFAKPVGDLLRGYNPNAIQEATLRDTLFSVETRRGIDGQPNTRTWTIWATHDDVGAYCTSNAEVAELALETLRAPAPYNEVVLAYRSINHDDPEFNLLGADGCAHDSDTQEYLVVSLEAVTPRPQ